MLTTTATLVHKYDSPSGNVSYVLFQPELTFSFAEGQFCMIEAILDDKLSKKPYSIATTNRMLQEEKLIWFVVKKASDNGMSAYLTQHITIGDTLTLKWPVGHYINPHTHPRYLFVSIWSGLSPNFWLFQQLVYENTEYDHIVNILGERTSVELVPYIQDRFTNHGSDRVTNFFCLSQEELQQTTFTHGHVQTKLADAIALLGTQTTCFVCGSPVGVTDVVYQLTQLGIAREDIIIEKY